MSFEGFARSMAIFYVALYLTFAQGMYRIAEWYFVDYKSLDKSVMTREYIHSLVPDIILITLIVSFLCLIISYFIANYVFDLAKVFYRKLLTFLF